MLTVPFPIRSPAPSPSRRARRARHAPRRSSGCSTARPIVSTASAGRTSSSCSPRTASIGCRRRPTRRPATACPIFWEDRNLMTVRMKRLAHPRAWSQKTAGAPTMWSERRPREGRRRQRRDRRPLALSHDGVPQRCHAAFRGLVRPPAQDDAGRAAHQAAARRHGERRRTVRVRVAGLGMTGNRAASARGTSVPGR